MKAHSISKGLFSSPIFDFKDNSGHKSKWSDPAFRWFFEKAAVEEEGNFHWIDRICAVALLALFSPVFIMVWAGIKLTMPGPVLYRQTRVGKNGRLFEVLKFRSMVADAEKSTGHTLSWNGDPRVTPFGKFLRKSHFDELPQLLNVIKGDMVFIGPRPERPEFTYVFEKEIPDYSMRHQVKPGITGLAQIACGYDAPAKEKLTYDLLYIEHKESPFLNGLIAYHTAKKMLLMQSTAKIVASAANA